METNKTIKTDTKCCRMKSERGYCPKPLESASSFISKKWTISIIVTIGNFSVLRFNDLLKRIGSVTAKTLADRLQELEKKELVKRRAYNETPPRVEYSLTENGTRLLKALSPLMHWAEHRKN